MEKWFHPAQELGERVAAAARAAGLDDTFAPEMRAADPRFGDFQANGALPYAKRNRTNPREIATKLLAELEKDEAVASGAITVSIAGPGFLNFSLSPQFLRQWLDTFKTEENLRAGASDLEKGHTVVIDFSGPNTAKQMHVGHLRSTVIGDAIARLLRFQGAKVISDNHIGDWGTQFGILIYQVKAEGFDLDSPRENPLEDLEDLYRRGSSAFKDDDEVKEQARQELVRLQQGDADNVRIWQKITGISWEAFEVIYQQLDIHFDEVLGESFYRDKVQQVYDELTELNIAEESQGALVVFHPEHKRFAKQPFIVRKGDGASNYATTDLATVLYRAEKLGANEIIYVTDTRQGDHFEQLFLTAAKWFEKSERPLPQLQHVTFGTVLGEGGKPIKTREGGSVKLKDLLAEAVDRARAIVEEKNPELPEAEKDDIATAVGLGSVRYADLAQNRSSDYIFSFEKMLSLEGNTAPYLLYAVARIHSIFRKAGLQPGEAQEGASAFETDEEIALARKLVGFVTALQQARSDLRPHFLSNYLYDLSGAFSTFYNANRVIVDEADVKARRLLLCARTLRFLEAGLHLLGLRTLERM